MKKNRWQEGFIDFVKTFFVSLVIILLLYHFVAIPVVVEGTSMNPNLQNNDFGFSFIITKNMGIHRFDVAVVSVKNSNKKLVKRVIGLPNEKIEYRQNILYINDVKVAENFLPELTLTNDFCTKLAEDEYFLLGDNREVSRDSRIYGAFKRNDFLSTHIWVVWPILHFGGK